MLVPGQRVQGPGESEGSHSASQQEVPGEENESRVRSLPATTTPIKYCNGAIIVTTDLFALCIRDC